MSGYLQRLAAGAVHPERTVHPFVSALFSSTRREGIVEETNLANSSPMQRSEREDAQISAERKGPMELRNDAASEEPLVEPAVPMLPEVSTMSAKSHGHILSAQALRNTTTSSTAQPVELLLPRHPPSAATPERRAEARTREVHQAVDQVDKRTPEDRAARTPLEPLSVAVQPLLVEKWEAAARDERPMPQNVHGAGMRRPDQTSHTTAKAHLATDRTGPEARRESRRGSEDIQIHIGRIEVIAVQQPAARAMVPSRKSQTLDEYLKRRDGRAR